MNRDVQLFYFVLVCKVALKIPHFHHYFFLIACEVLCDAMTLVYYMNNYIVFWI